MPLNQTATDGTLTSLGAKIAAYEHPVYQTYLPIWRQLAHVREGSGGFLDGTYLVAHPREWRDYSAETPVQPTKKLLARRKLASYENFASTILDAKKSALFREPPVRRLDGVDADGPVDGTIRVWWDGGPTADDLSAQLMPIWDAAATFGHVFLYVERSTEGGPPYLCAYTPLDVPDWLMNERGELSAVKFLEPVPRAAFTSPLQTAQYRYRIVDETSWTLYSHTGERMAGGEHGMGKIPVVVLYTQRRPITPLIGQSVLTDPKLYIDLYNLLSEVRELLRNQTFSILNVPLGTGQDAMSVEQFQALNTTTGTENVLYSGLAADFIAADATNVQVYQREIDRRLRIIYRLAAIQWESDSRDAEAEGSLRLKREDMNQRLAAYADELERVEYQLADLWYRAVYGADLGPQRFKRDEVVIAYPQSFDVSPFADVLAQAQAALSLGMPESFLNALRKSLVGKFLPSLAPAALAEIEDDIDQTIEPAESEPGPEDDQVAADQAVRRQVAS